MRIDLIESPNDDLLEAVKGEVRRHNEASSGAFWEKSGRPEYDRRAFNLFAFSAEGQVLAGLLGWTRFSWLTIELMATKETQRGRGIGRALLARAESLATDRGCTHVYVDTMDHQAPGFYSRAGYRIAGTLDDWDSHGHSKLLFVKDLV